MRFILASNNRNKLAEIKAVLSGLDAEVLSQSEAGLDFEAEETGTTFEENALIKARTACLALGEPAIADDSGLMTEALEGAPGVFSARFGGCKTDPERVEYLLKKLEGEENRRAKFVSCIACVFPDGDVITARGECEGEIALEPRGDGGFGYDPIFVLPSGKTMAELSPGEKNLLSHRGKALRKFEDELREYYVNK